ncbi:MAG: hypothetical protein OET44_14830 [Gammaproteobacteria bacterium]|nr:hypothetical protein [Gammaproteobacteria bacterium]
MRHSTLALATVLSMSAGAGADIACDNLLPTCQRARIVGAAEGEVAPRTTILQGFVYIPDETFTLVPGADWLTSRIAAANLLADEGRTVFPLQGRFRLSAELGLLLGLVHIELDADVETNVYRANLATSHGETPVGIVF